jgi:hypothetical protein
MSAARILKEVLLAFGLLAIGLFGLPALIYLVGQTLVGEYAGGLNAFYLALADSLASGNAFAWILIASPCLTIELMRLWLRLGRRRRDVTEFTESSPQ